MRRIGIVTLCASPSSLAFLISQFRPLRQTSRTRRILGLSSSESTVSLDTVGNATASEQTFKREPPFPMSAYHLAIDEKRLDYRFMSFIDYSSEPYSQVTRLVEPRSYARTEQFDKSMMNVPHTIDDVAPPPSLYGSLGEFLAWNKLPARAVVGSLAYFAFPWIVAAFEYITSDVVERQSVLDLVNTFLPGVSIVLGTYFSLTLGILYDRFSRLQETVSVEASLLALTCQNLLDLFYDDKEAAVEGTQCIADQVRTLVRESRGREIMGVIYSDPYQRILRLCKERNVANDQLDSQLLSNVRGAINELFRVRAKRMADEALALAPTHFDVMTFLSGLFLTGFALSAVECDAGAELVTRILFSALIVCYVVLYEMSFDLNRPFDGVYQLRRSGAAMHFLEIKHIISNHPVVKGKIDFEEVPSSDDDLPLRECEVACKRSKEKIWFN